MVVRASGLRAVVRRCSFSALSVEPYGGSNLGRTDSVAEVNFQCSLCRAVWWFDHVCQTCIGNPSPFSALSVEPYGGSPIARPRLPADATSFSALSVEPYGGSSEHTINVVPVDVFQCSLCRAVWWFMSNYHTKMKG